MVNMIELSEENDQKYREQLKGKEVTVLVEGLNKKTGEYEGYSENYLRFSFKSETDITGQFIKLKL